MGCEFISIKAKDTPWDAVLTGSVVCTVGANLQQIVYYFETGLLQKTKAKIILKEVKELIEYIEQKTENNPKFHLYENELMHLSNDIFLHHPKKSLIAVPLNTFGYILINDEKTCQETYNYFEHQIKNSKSLTTSARYWSSTRRIGNILVVNELPPSVLT